MGINVSVRDVDERVFRDFKAVIAREGMNTGAAITEALGLFLQKFKVYEKKKKQLTDFEPFSWGAGNEKLSSQVDEILYGWKR